MDWQFLINSSVALLVSAFLLDLAIGDPGWLPHPVVLMGKFIAWGERFLLSSKAWKDFVLPPLFSFLLTVGLLSTTLATRGLLDAATRIETPLRAGDLAEAREKLSHIVGRETSSLNEDKVIRASLESLAESTCDGIVAPLFYFCLGGIPLAMAYKAVNTLDSMIGYRTERYFYFGKFAARLDDIFNFLPARITAFFMVVATFILKLNATSAFTVLWRDHANHLSPNAGYPEAALAGAFGIQLGGPSIYFGKEVRKPYIGDDLTPVRIEMLKEGRVLCLVTAILSLATFALLSIPRG
jgi:adenosylcobinamide-phosphate synthase